jgi:DNA polymerase III subunit epsilon
MKTIFIDCETTGTDPAKNALVQMAGAMFIDGTLVEQFDIKSRPFPGDVLDDEALQVNGLTPLELSAYPDPRHAYRDFAALLSKHCDKYNRADKFHFIGYNADFDSDFIRRFFEKNGDNYFGSFFWYPALDVSKLAGIRFMSSRHKLPNFRLMTVAEACGIEIDPAQAHDALYDIRITMRIFKKLTKDLALFEFAANEA